MQERRIARNRNIRLLRSRGLWVCLLAGLFAVAVTERPGAGVGVAQSASQQPSVNAGSGAGTQASLPDQVAKPEVHHAAHDAGDDPRKKQIAEDSANLFKLANNLKAEVDKTTPDTLSVPVVRQAAEIEKLAHEMRTK
jgi:hypothetical protein